MLIETLKFGEGITLEVEEKQVMVRVLKCDAVGNSVLLAIDAPRSMPVLRGEVWAFIQQSEERTD